MRRPATIECAQQRKHDLEPADPMVTKLLHDIGLARQFERWAWKRLADHLAQQGHGSGQRAQTNRTAGQ
jgi:hypothetical protein